MTNLTDKIINVSFKILLTLILIGLLVLFIGYIFDLNYFKSLEKFITDQPTDIKKDYDNIYAMKNYWGQIRNKNTDNCLDVAGIGSDKDSVLFNDCGIKDTELWKLNLNNNIINYPQYKCLNPVTGDAAINSNMNIVTCDPGVNSQPGGSQSWSLEKLDDKYFRIKNNKSNLCLTPLRDGLTNDSAVIGNCLNDDMTIWYFTQQDGR